jgi:hypothetical protein
MPRRFDDVALTLDRVAAYLAGRGTRLAFLPAFERVRLLPPG